MGQKRRKKSDLPLLGPIFSCLVTLVSLPKCTSQGLLSWFPLEQSHTYLAFHGVGMGKFPQHIVGVSAPTIISSLSQKAMHQSFCEIIAFICVKFQSFSLHGVFDWEYLSGVSLKPALPVL